MRIFDGYFDHETLLGSNGLIYRRDKIINAVNLLQYDHKVVKKLLARLTDISERAVKTRAELLQKIDIELAVHGILKSRVFIPRIKQRRG